MSGEGDPGRSSCDRWRDRLGSVTARFDPIVIRLTGPLRSIRRDRTESTVFTTVVSGLTETLRRDAVFSRRVQAGPERVAGYVGHPHGGIEDLGRRCGRFHAAY